MRLTHADAVARLHKKPLGQLDEFKIFQISGREVRDNIDVSFALGGNGFAYHWVPKDEIWVEPVEDWKEIAVHEAAEARKMRDAGMTYDAAHHIANETEAADRRVEDNVPAPYKEGSKLNFDPLPHQERVSDKLDAEPGQLMFHTLGSGKTKGIVNAAHEHDLPLLAIVPASLRNNMNKEIQSSGFKHPAKVVSYDEAVKRMDDPEFREFASKSLVAYDEAHRGTSEGGKRRALLSSLPAAKRILATATPARNAPAELAPLINSMAPGSLPDSSADFNAKFLQTTKHPVSFMGWLRGQKPTKTVAPKNLHEFEQAVRGKVDFYHAADRTHYPSSDESIINVPMTGRQHATYKMVMGKYPMLMYKIKHGLPPSKSDEGDFRSFMSGPRQVVNHPGPYNSSATDDDAPKIRAAVDEIEKRRAKDPNFRGVTYSAFLGTGVHPLSRELERRGIPHAVFTGEQGDEERKQTVENYNKGKTPVLLLSGAGAEGLDLKGTKLMQILEPHWNEELVDQVRGRAIRYKSHEALPPNERHVEVQRFHAVPPPSWLDKAVGRTRGTEQGADEYLYNIAQKKRAMLKPFLEILKGRTADELEAEARGEKKTADAAPGVIWCDHEAKQPGVLLDLDDTTIETPGKYGPTELGEQRVMPNVLETLRSLKAKGYRLIGVTNRSRKYIADVCDLFALNQEAMGLLEHLLDDILCCPQGDPLVLKPSPILLWSAIERHNLDPHNTIMVGNNEDDHGAATAAGIPFVHRDAFFALNWLQLPEGVPTSAPDQLASRRWVCDGMGNIIGKLVCSGQDAVYALRKQITAAAYKRGNPVPEMITDEDSLTVKIPDTEGPWLDFAAEIDRLYEE